jgi:zinc protease
MQLSSPCKIAVYAAWIAVIGSSASAQQKKPSPPLATTAVTQKPPPESTKPNPLARLPIVRHTLENGLRVILSRDTTVPTVAIAVYYNVGSRNEEKGASGYAHLFEHLMFQGSRNIGKMEHFKLITERGGQANGGTGQDSTGYYETLPSNELELGLWLEADRMRSLAVTQENFENQRQTVMEERRESYENEPYMESTLRINELAYGSYFPYAHSTIGDMADLRRATLQTVRAFYDTYYVPNNAVLVIAGDFEESQAISLVRRHFGDIARRDVTAFKPAPFEPQSAERVESMQDPLAELPAFHIAYHIPPDRDSDHYPLDLLAIVLGDGASSRLYQKLVKQLELVQQIRIDTDGRQGPDLFSVWAICAKGKRCAAVREVIFRAFDQIAKEGISPQELQKAKNRVRSHFVFGIESNLSRAERLGEFELLWGDARLLVAELDRYLAVKREDIQRVAAHYFVAPNRTVLDVIPQKTAAAPPTPASSTAKPRHHRPLSERIIP